MLPFRFFRISEQRSNRSSSEEEKRVTVHVGTSSDKKTLSYPMFASILYATEKNKRKNSNPIYGNLKKNRKKRTRKRTHSTAPPSRSVRRVKKIRKKITTTKRISRENSELQ